MYKNVLKKLTDDYYNIVVKDIPLIDVRAPKEFKKGAFPNAYNFFLMNNRERHKVGKCYSEKGHDAAVALGHKLVSGKKKKERIQTWIDFIEENPESVI